jgi:hypothetical protein
MQHAHVLREAATRAVDDDVDVRGWRRPAEHGAGFVRVHMECGDAHGEIDAKSVRNAQYAARKPVIEESAAHLAAWERSGCTQELIVEEKVIHGEAHEKQPVLIARIFHIHTLPSQQNRPSGRPRRDAERGNARAYKAIRVGKHDIAVDQAEQNL